MSFNHEFASQRDFPGTQFDPEPSVCGPFDRTFSIHEDDESALSTLKSSQLEVPTQFLETNEDSVVALAEPAPAISMPFRYEWIDWNAGARPLRGFELLERHKRTSAWWWRCGVPLIGPRINAKTKRIERTECFLCKACHLASPTLEEPMRTQGGSKGVTKHFRDVHYKTYKEHVTDAISQLNRDYAIESFDSSDLKQQAVYNRLAEASDPDVLRKDIFRWIVYDNVPFEKINSPYFKKILQTANLLLNINAVPNPRTVSRWITQEFPIHKQEIRANMKSAISRIHLAFDLWTSSRRKAINGITAN